MHPEAFPACLHGQSLFSRPLPGPRVRAALLTLPLLALLVAPMAFAQPGKTLSDFEEPVLGDNLVVDFTVTAEEADKPGIAVFLNPPSRGFGLVVYRADGSTAYERNGTRGVQPFPALPEGAYKAFVRGNGAFQITPRHLDRLGSGAQVTEANGTLRGTDAYVLAPTRGWVLHVEGDVQAELRDLGGPTRTLSTPVAANVSTGAAYVLSLRGEEGSAYRVWLEPTGPEPSTLTPPTAGRGQAGGEKTPGAGPLLVALAACAALALRRRA